MTDSAFEDERIVVPARSVATEERIYLKELAKFLHHRSGVLRQFAKKRALLHTVSLGSSKGAAEYLTPYGAMRVIAYIRALQGAEYQRGKDFHRIREQWAQERARRMTKCAQNASVLNEAAGSVACNPPGRHRR